ncbi:MAG: hypothetical protein JWM79_2149 [Nocardioides sp.]|nr:hypothetical protein [Nocardioides sp.]
MFVRRSPAIVLSLVLSSAALAMMPSALASDGGPAKDVDDCMNASTYKLKVSIDEDGRLAVVGAVFSEDDDYWSWKLRHNGDLSASGEVKAREDIDRSFRVVRTMGNFDGPDWIVFRAENERSGEVCRGELYY